MTAAFGGLMVLASAGLFWAALLWNWTTTAEAGGVAIAAIFIVIAALASWRMGKPSAEVLASNAAARADALRSGSTRPILALLSAIQRAVRSLPPVSILAKSDAAPVRRSWWPFRRAG